ncbi:MAG TPA: hypothetical protein VFM93_12165 [Candidatus Limnocylindria bacterium]|nr:hypothetical protein [Candidatus Limnocylindria bacterium]
MTAGQMLRAIAMSFARAKARRVGIDLDDASAIARGRRLTAVGIVEHERGKLRPAA